MGAAAEGSLEADRDGLVGDRPRTSVSQIAGAFGAWIGPPGIPERHSLVVTFVENPPLFDVNGFFCGAIVVVRVVGVGRAVEPEKLCAVIDPDLAQNFADALGQTFEANDPQVGGNGVT